MSLMKRGEAICCLARMDQELQIFSNWVDLSDAEKEIIRKITQNMRDLTTSISHNLTFKPHTGR